MNIEKILEAMSPEIYQKFKTAIELGKWADGKVLTSEQKETCMQAVIAYEHKNLDESQRIGFIEHSQCLSSKNTDMTAEETLRWQPTQSN